MEQLEECPVCTLFLREGMTMKQHLETHSKEQVVEALLEKRAAAVRNQAAIAQPQQMTTAVTYQQILTTNAAGTVVPQILQVPTMINNPFQMASQNVGFAVPMLNMYNSFLPQTFTFNGTTASVVTQRGEVVSDREERHMGETVVYEEAVEEPEEPPPPPPSVIISRGPRRVSFNSEPRIETPPPHVEVVSLCKEESVIVERTLSKSPCKLEKYDLDRLPPLTPHPETVHEQSEEFVEVDCDSGVHSQHHRVKEYEPVDLGFEYTDEAANLEEPVVFTDLLPSASHGESFMELDGIRIFFNGAALTASEQKASSVIQMADSTKSEVKDVSPMAFNIAADESMPARGELSEQESMEADSAWGLFQDVKLVERVEGPRPFKCSLCNESFACPKERRVHKNQMHLKLSKFFRCTVCAQQFPTLRDRRTHMAIHDDVKVKVEEGFAGKRICAICGANFLTLKTFRQHLREIHGQVRFQCETCKETFDDEQDMNAHYRIHPLKCPQCQREFPRRFNLNLHMKRHLAVKPFECSLCPKAFVTRQKLDEHTNGHAGIRPIKCTLCSKTFSRHSNLIQHRNMHHLKKIKPTKDYVCRCGEVFHSLRKLEWHREIHDNKPKSCPHCSQKFIHAASVTRHIRRSHIPDYLPKGSREENVACPACDTICLRSSLTVHMRVHNGERPFHCNICTKQFSTKWNMELHQWTHQSRSGMPFKCTLCKSAFFRETDYNSHLNAHKNLKPFICNVCGQKFIRKYNCIRHQEEHQRAKRFACTVRGCDRKFHRSYYLKDHMKIHTGVRPHTCHICGKTSSTKSNHNKHVRIHDTREPVNTEN